MNDADKIKTSVQYQVSNVVLFNEVFYNWSNFFEKLNQGPDTIIDYLFELWNNTKEELKNNDRVIARDIERIVDFNDFNVTYNRTQNGTNVFYMVFPDYDYTDAASKYVAIALTKGRPRYFTLEYSVEFSPEGPLPCFVVGEFLIDNNEKKHIYHTKSDNMRLSWFSGWVIGQLEAENN